VCVAHIRSFLAQNPRFIRFFKTVRFPEEFVFQTILANSSLRDSLVDRSLTFTDWIPGSPHPNVLRKEQLGALAQSPALFGRKFDVTVDEEVLDQIDVQLLQRPAALQRRQT
jgi:hypothetical protein